MRPGWLNSIIGAAIVAGGSGLVLGAVTASQVQDLRNKSEAANEAQVKIREDISSLKTSVQNIEKRQEEDREERRAAEQRVNDKLDELLRK